MLQSSAQRSIAFCSHASVPLTSVAKANKCVSAPVRLLPRNSLSPAPQTRRVIAAASAAVVVFVSLAPAFAVISAEKCIGGEGPGCEAAAAESPVIRELLEKSKANRARHEKETLEKYWAQGYGDYFSYGYNKQLVKDDDGKWSLQSPNDTRSRIENRIIEFIRGKKN